MAAIDANTPLVRMVTVVATVVITPKSPLKVGNISIED